MSIKNNQIEIPFTQADSDKLDSVDTGAEANPPVATQVVAEGGVDNFSYMTALSTKQAIDFFASGGEANTGANVGAGVQVFKDKTGVDLNFRTFLAGPGMSIMQGTNTITFSSSGGSSADLRGDYENDSGDDLDALKLVWSKDDGTIDFVNPSVEAQVMQILGVLPEAILDTEVGAVVFAGLIKDVSTSYNIGDVLYLAKDGDYTTTPPDIGGEGFIAGDFIVRVGMITENADNPGDKDFKLDIKVVGAL